MEETSCVGLWHSSEEMPLCAGITTEARLDYLWTLYVENFLFSPSLLIEPGLPHSIYVRPRRSLPVSAVGKGSVRTLFVQG
jgi:hypothetical protein